MPLCWPFRGVEVVMGTKGLRVVLAAAAVAVAAAAGAAAVQPPAPAAHAVADNGVLHGN